MILQDNRDPANLIIYNPRENLILKNETNFLESNEKKALKEMVFSKNLNLTSEFSASKEDVFKYN